MSQYLRELRAHNAAQTTTGSVLATDDIQVPGRRRPVRVISTGSVVTQTGAVVRIPGGMREPRTGCLSANFNLLATLGSGCVLSLLVFGIVTVLLPSLSRSPFLLFAAAAVLGFLGAFAIQRRILAPYFSQLDSAESRWRRSRHCPRCDVVFVSDETVYTSAEFLDRLVWSPQPSKP